MPPRAQCGGGVMEGACPRQEERSACRSSSGSWRKKVPWFAGKRCPSRGDAGTRTLADVADEGKYPAFRTKRRRQVEQGYSAGHREGELQATLSCGSKQRQAGALCSRRAGSRSPSLPSKRLAPQARVGSGRCPQAAFRLGGHFRRSHFTAACTLVKPLLKGLSRPAAFVIFLREGEVGVPRDVEHEGGFGQTANDRLRCGLRQDGNRMLRVCPCIGSKLQKSSGRYSISQKHTSLPPRENRGTRCGRAGI